MNGDSRKDVDPPNRHWKTSYLLEWGGGESKDGAHESLASYLIGKKVLSHGHSLARKCLYLVLKNPKNEGK